MTPHVRLESSYYVQSDYLFLNRGEKATLDNLIYIIYIWKFCTAWREKTKLIHWLETWIGIFQALIERFRGGDADKLILIELWVIFFSTSGSLSQRSNRVKRVSPCTKTVWKWINLCLLIQTITCHIIQQLTHWHLT